MGWCRRSMIGLLCAVASAAQAQILRLVEKLNADRGLAVVLITHKLRDALAVADDVTVLRRGRTVLTAAARDTTQEQLDALQRQIRLLSQQMQSASPAAEARDLRDEIPPHY